MGNEWDLMMGFGRAILIAALLAAVLAGCGGRADIPATTFSGGQSEFSARQTRIAAQGATSIAADPTITQTPTRVASPTRTPLPTATLRIATRSPVATSDSTRESVVGAPPTKTPEPTQPEMVIAEITGCGPDPITIQVTSDNLAGNVDEWQQIGSSSRAISEGWDKFFAIIDDFFVFNQVVNNTKVFDGAAAFKAVAEEQLPALQAIEELSPFYALSQTVIATTMDQIAVGDLLTRAGTENDQTYWDQALEISSSFNRQAQNFATEFDLACGFWEGQQ